MTDVQLYLAAGIPTFAVIVALLVNLAQQSATNHRIDDLGVRLDKRIEDLKDLLRSELRRIEERLARLESPIVRG